MAPLRFYPWTFALTSLGCRAPRERALLSSYLRLRQILSFVVKNSGGIPCMCRSRRGSCRSRPVVKWSVSSTIVLHPKLRGSTCEERESDIATHRQFALFAHHRPPLQVQPTCQANLSKKTKKVTPAGPQSSGPPPRQRTGEQAKGKKTCFFFSLSVRSWSCLFESPTHLQSSPPSCRRGFKRRERHVEPS